MILALVLPVSITCLVMSLVSLGQIRETTYSMNHNALSFYLSQVSLRHELGDIDALKDFPSALAPRLTLLYWNSGAQGDDQAYNGGSVYVSADGKGTYIIHPNGSWEKTDKSFEEVRTSPNAFVWDEEGRPFRAAVTFPYDFALRYIPAWFWIANLISLVTILISPILFGRLKRDILEPMQTLSRAIDHFQEDQAYRIPEPPLAVSDDFQHLFEHFNRMAADVQSAHEKDLQLIETEMENLRLQVNPHMLLNSYNMIYALAESKNYSVIQDYTLCLVDYFRYVLRRNQQQVTVRQELAFVENFIRIQRIRFPGRFSYVYQAEEDCLSAQIPPLLIENFVENAVKYALNPTQPTEIMVAVRRETEDGERETLHISITDTGSGIRPEVLEKLRNREPYVDEAGQKHIGIYNCLRRVELFYGDEGDIRFSSVVGGGTQVYLVIPFVTAADAGEGRA